MTFEAIPYSGTELPLFAAVINWRRYWQQQTLPFIGKTVLEIGAGLGTITRDLCGPPVESWLAVEPDPAMAQGLATSLPPHCSVRHGTLTALSAEERFDTALYCDVLEHIADDRAEIARAMRHLEPDGHLVVLAPAHQGLFSALDRAVGHFRRYSRQQLLDLGPDDAVPVLARYLDSVGLLALSGNRFLLNSPCPTPAQLRLWDRWMVPPSRWLDPVLGYRVGRSVLVIWRKS